MTIDGKPLILTARMDGTAQAFFNEQREAYFPADRNYLDAHLTLFHKLPEAQLVQIRDIIRNKCRQQTPMSATAESLIFLGFGSGYKIDCAPLTDLRHNLARDFKEWLTPQDAQKFKPHVTIQNKVKAADAKALFAELDDRFAPFSFSITGLDLWYYMGGPWEHCAAFDF